MLSKLSVVDVSTMRASDTAPLSRLGTAPGERLLWK